MREKTLELLKNKKFTQLKLLLNDASPVDVAALLSEMEKEDILLIFRLLSKDIGAEVFSEISHDIQEDLINSLTDKEIKDVMDELYTDDAVDIIEEMPANLVNRLLKTFKTSERKIINQFLSYPEESAGSVMTNEFIDLKVDITVKDALDKIRKEGKECETIHTCYVLNKTRKLIGLVSIRQLLLADINTKIEDIMNTNII